MRAVAAGAAHSLALLRTCGTAFAWGANECGQLGTGDAAPRPAPAEVAAPGGQRFAAVACGARHSLLLAEGGLEVLGCGRAAQGQLLQAGAAGRLLVPVELALPFAVQVRTAPLGLGSNPVPSPWRVRGDAVRAVLGPWLKGAWPACSVKGKGF